MKKLFENASVRHAGIRAACDYVLVHICMVAALSGSICYHLAVDDNVKAAALIGTFWRYYVYEFVALSFVFPLVLYFNGVYTRCRSYQKGYKNVMVVRSTIIAVLAYLFGNYLLFRGDILPRSVAIIFSIGSACALIAVRHVKAGVEKRFAITPAKARDSAKGQTVLVVGGAGYIGCVLVRQLLDRNYRVRVLDKLVYGDGAIAGLHGDPNFELIVGDCRNIQNVVAAVKDVAAIIHLAAIVGDPACDQDRALALEVNYAATRMLIEIAKGNGVKRVIFASSCSVYGATEQTMDENSAVLPISLYGETKVDSEQALLHARSDEFQPVILRLATVFGHSHRSRFDLVVNLLVAKAGQERAITIFNGEQWRPFIHVSDVARGFVRVLEAPLSVVGGQIFNLGDSQMNYRLSDIGEKIRQLYPETRVEHIENNDRRNYRVSFDKIRQQLGFKCTISLDEGIRELKRVFEQGLVGDYKDVRFHNQKFLSTNGELRRPNDVDSHVMAAFQGARKSA